MFRYISIDCFSVDVILSFLFFVPILRVRLRCLSDLLTDLGETTYCPSFTFVRRDGYCSQHVGIGVKNHGMRSLFLNQLFFSAH